MSYFYCSPISNIPLQPPPQPALPSPLASQPQVEAHPFAVRMARTGSNSSNISTSSTSSSVSIPSSYNHRCRADSTSADFSSPWSSPPSGSMSTSSCYSYGHSRHNSHNQTPYLPTPYRSALQHSCSSPGWSATKESPSSYFTDSELISPGLQSVFSDQPATTRHEMTTEEQVAAVRAQVEREREELPTDTMWRHQRRLLAMDKRARMTRYAGESSRQSSTSGYPSKIRAGRSGKSSAVAPDIGHRI